MSPIFLVLAALAIVILAFVANNLSTRTNKKPKHLTNDDEQKDEPEEDFLRIIQEGDKPRALARVYSQMELTLLTSVLSSKKVASYTLFPNTSNSGMGMSIEGYNDTVIFVLDSQFERGKDVLLDYIRERKSNTVEVKAKTKVRNVAELLGAGFANPNERLPELIEEE